MIKQKNNIFKLKIIQVFLASITTFLIIQRWYAEGELPLSDSPHKYSAVEQFLGYVFIIPGLFWCILLWNRWLYDDLFSEKMKKTFTYHSFQLSFTYALFFMMLFMFF